MQIVTIDVRSDLAVARCNPEMADIGTYPEYGSLAYAAYGMDDEVDWEARHVDAEQWNDPFYVA
jgi:hypothetical protein